MLLIILVVLAVVWLVAKVHDLTRQNRKLMNENHFLWLSNNRLAWDTERALSELKLTCKEHQIQCYYHSRNRRVKHADTACTTRH